MMLSTPIIKSIGETSIIAPFVMNLIGRILEGNTFFINYENSGQPYITDPNGYIPSREDFDYFFDCVQQWYAEMSDDDIELYNKLMEFENLICPDPSLVKDQDTRPGYVYIIKADTGHYKVGRTKNIPNRMNFFGVKLPFEFELILTLPVIDMHKAESILHNLWGYCRANGEWFNPAESELNYLISRLGEYDFFSKRDQASTENVTVTL